MKCLYSWIWKLLFFAYISMALERALELLVPMKKMNLYYHILIAYDARFLLPFCLNALSVILNVLAIVPIYLFITRHHLLSQKFWKLFLFLRLSCDLFGRSYERAQMLALFHQDAHVALEVLALAVAIYLPSYLANFIIAFDKRSA